MNKEVILVLFTEVLRHLFETVPSHTHTIDANMFLFVVLTALKRSFKNSTFHRFIVLVSVEESTEFGVIRFYCNYSISSAESGFSKTVYGPALWIFPE